jgi:DNA-binding response OmpR family regulator
MYVDTDIGIGNIYNEIMVKRNFEIERAATMIEAIQKLSIFNKYLFIAINSDTIHFMTLLPTLRWVTNDPILIGTSDFIIKIEIEAMDKGADLYARWNENPEDNVASCLSHVNRKTERNKTPIKIVSYGNLLLNPSFREVFIETTEVKLNRKEFDILHYLMVNRGRIMTYTQILHKVWGDEYSDNGLELLWRTVDRLRKKLIKSSGGREYIKTEHGTGYKYLS